MNRVYLDSNVILRLFLGDVASQKQRADALFTKIEQGEVVGYLSILVVNEIMWILEHFYGSNRGRYVPKLIKLLGMRHIKVAEIEKNNLVELLEKFQTKAIDFTDIYLSFIAKDKGEIASFDKDLVRLKAKLVNF